MPSFAKVCPTRCKASTIFRLSASAYTSSWNSSRSACTSKSAWKSSGLCGLGSHRIFGDASTTCSTNLCCTPGVWQVQIIFITFNNLPQRASFAKFKHFVKFAVVRASAHAKPTVCSFRRPFKMPSPFCNLKQVDNGINQVMLMFC